MLTIPHPPVPAICKYKSSTSVKYALGKKNHLLVDTGQILKKKTLLKGTRKCIC